jgi:glycosyltransferase involved in cell wall biosynthesis
MMISFVIPAYNEERNIRRCIASVLRDARGCGHDVEIIVVDNACTDRTAAIASSMPGVRVVSEPRKGIVFARQAGFLASRGELLACIDADSMIKKGWIRRAVTAFERSPRLAALSGPYLYYDLSSFTQLLVVLWYVGASVLFGHIIQYVFRRSAMLQGGNYVVRRCCMQRIGGYDMTITFYGEDIALATRLVSAGRVRFDFFFMLRTSGRRLRKEGVIVTGARYAANALSVFARGSAVSHRYTDIRET